MRLYDEAGTVPRVVRRTAGARPMAWLYGHIQEPLDRFVYRRTSGKATLTAWLGDVELTMLTTIGAKSGQQRERYFERGIDIYPGFIRNGRRAHRRIPVLALDLA